MRGTAVFMMATLQKGCNISHFLPHVPCVWHSPGRSRFIFHFVAHSKCMSCTQFPICLDNLSLSLWQMFLKYGPPLHLYLIRFVLISTEQQTPKNGASASGAERPIIIPRAYIHEFTPGKPSNLYFAGPRMLVYRGKPNVTPFERYHTIPKLLVHCTASDAAGTITAFWWRK